MGEGGLLLIECKLAPTDELADRLQARVRENADNEVIEIMWGAPGTMLATRAMLDWTGDERWADAWRESAESVWFSREADGVWTKRLYGITNRGRGPPHGVVGNVLALLQDLLASERRETIEQETPAVLARNAVVEDGLANWPLLHSGDLVDPADGEIRVQWCAGAPGIIISAAPYLDEELLLAGAELTWRAGPPGMEKGSRICDGTAANGYAFLKAFERTGDELWLDRARRFARSRPRSGRAPQPRPLLALDGRRRRRPIRRRLPGGAHGLPGHGFPRLVVGRLEEAEENGDPDPHRNQGDEDPQEERALAHRKPLDLDLV